MPDFIFAAWAFIAGLFAGTFWGWAVIAFFVIIIAPLADSERTGKAFLSAIALAFMVWLVVGWNVLAIIWYNPITAVVCALGYFALGGLWSVVKWDRFVKAATEEFHRAREAFIEEWRREVASYSPPDPSQRVRADSRRTLTDRLGIRDKDEAALKAELLVELGNGKIPDALLTHWLERKAAEVPSPFSYKEKILNWVAFWPWSMVAYMILDLLRDLANFVWERLIGVYAAVVRRRYAGIDPRLLKAPRLGSS